MKNEHLTRQADLIDSSRAASIPITIIGAGAIGSWAALTLTKSGFTNLTVYDHDEVDVVNMSSQGYRFKDIGKPKVEALREIIADFTGDASGMRMFHAKWTPDIHASGIIIAAVDSMETRRKIMEDVKANMFKIKYIIDPRMSAEVAMLYTYKPSDSAAYEKTLYTDADAVQERCTAKATIYTSNMLAGMVVQTVKQITCGEPHIKTALWNIKEGSLDLWKSTPPTC